MMEDTRKEIKEEGVTVSICNEGMDKCPEGKIPNSESREDHIDPNGTLLTKGNRSEDLIGRKNCAAMNSEPIDCTVIPISVEISGSSPVEAAGSFQTNPRMIPAFPDYRDDGNHTSDDSSDSDSSSEESTSEESSSEESSTDEAMEDDIKVAAENAESSHCKDRPKKKTEPNVSKKAKKISILDEFKAWGLQAIEDLTITVREDIKLEPLGAVTGLVDVLAVVKANRGTPALEQNTILFTEDRTPIGKVFDTFGTVESPMYSIRFNTVEHMQEKNIKIGTQVLFAPQELSWTQFVFVDQLLRAKVCDDQGDDPQFSDDESEKRFLAKSRERTDNEKPDHKKIPRSQNQEPGRFRPRDNKIGEWPPRRSPVTPHLRTGQSTSHMYLPGYNMRPPPMAYGYPPLNTALPPPELKQLASPSPNFGSVPTWTQPRYPSHFNVSIPPPPTSTVGTPQLFNATAPPPPLKGSVPPTSTSATPPLFNATAPPPPLLSFPPPVKGSLPPSSTITTPQLFNAATPPPHTASIPPSNQTISSQFNALAAPSHSTVTPQPFNTTAPPLHVSIASNPTISRFNEPAPSPSSDMTPSPAGLFNKSTPQPDKSIPHNPTFISPFNPFTPASSRLATSPTFNTAAPSHTFIAPHPNPGVPPSLNTSTPPPSILPYNAATSFNASVPHPGSQLSVPSYSAQDAPSIHFPTQYFSGSSFPLNPNNR